MPDDQNNSQDPQLNNNQPSFEPVSPPTPTTPPVETPVAQPVVATPETVTPPVVPLEPVAQAPVEPTPAVFGSGPEVVAAPVVTPKKSKKGLLIGLIIAAVLVVLGGGTALAYNFWYQNPDKVVTDALVNTISARTALLTGTADLKTDDYSVKVTIDAKSGTENAEVAVNLEYTAGGKTYKLDGAGHFSKEGDLYVKVNNVKDVLTALVSGEDVDLTMFDDLVSKVEGNWIKISSEDLGTYSKEYKETQTCIENVTNEVKANKALSNEVMDLYSKNTFIVVEESLGSRTINGVGSLGYVIDLDPAKAKTFVTGLEATEVGKKIKACDDSYDFKAFADSIETKKDETANGKVQLWASRFGHELTEVNAAGSNDSTTFNAVINPVFNKDVTIETPTESMSIDTLQAEIEKAFTEYYSSVYSSYYSIEQ